MLKIGRIAGGCVVERVGDEKVNAMGEAGDGAEELFEAVGAGMGAVVDAAYRHVRQTGFGFEIPSREAEVVQGALKGV